MIGARRLVVGLWITREACSREGALSWLDEQIDGLLAALPNERDLSFLEVTLFCLVTRLSFREVLPIARYSALPAFATRFAQRESAGATSYRFDRGGPPVST